MSGVRIKVGLRFRVRVWLKSFKKDNTKPSLTTVPRF